MASLQHLCSYGYVHPSLQQARSIKETVVKVFMKRPINKLSFKWNDNKTEKKLMSESTTSMIGERSYWNKIFAEDDSQKQSPQLSLNFLQKKEQQEGGNIDMKLVGAVGGFGIVMLLAMAATIPEVSSLASSFDFQDSFDAVSRFFQDPQASFKDVVLTIESLDTTQKALYFFAVYTIAEILAVPCIPLTASAGYLFGVVQGTSIVLASASISAAVSFLIGRTILRSYVESLLEEYPDFQKIDKAIGKEGFKLMLLLRLSPVFPFALSNYLYGVTSVEFWPYFWGTMIGFTPGTIAYVYSGEVGKALTMADGTAEPWYVYLAGFTLLGGFLKILADVATGIIKDVEYQDQ